MAWWRRTRPAPSIGYWSTLRVRALGCCADGPMPAGRIDDQAISRLVRLQSSLLVSAADQVAEGGRLIYSVCTLTRAETIGVAAVIDDRFEPIDVRDQGDLWRPLGDHGGMVLPQDHDTDGMAVFAWRRTG